MVGWVSIDEAKKKKMQLMGKACLTSGLVSKRVTVMDEYGDYHFLKKGYTKLDLKDLEEN